MSEQTIDKFNAVDLTSADDLNYLLKKYILATEKGKPNKRAAENIIKAIQAREVYLEHKFQNEANEIEKFNKFLIEIGQADRIGIRRKILAVRKYIENMGNGTTT